MPLGDYAEHDLITANTRGGRGTTTVLTETGLEELDNMYKELFSIDAGDFSYDNVGITEWEQEFLENFFDKFIKYYEQYGKSAVVFCSTKQLAILYRIDKKIFGAS